MAFVCAEKVIGILRFWPEGLVGSRLYHDSLHRVWPYLAGAPIRLKALTRAGGSAHACDAQRHLKASHSHHQAGLADQSDRQGKAERKRVGKGFVVSRSLYGQPWKFSLGLGLKSRALQLSAPTNHAPCCDWLQTDGPNLRRLTSDGIRWPSK